MTVYQLALPPGTKILSQNDRMHWRTKARHVQQMRADAAWLARAARIPRLEQVRIVAVYHPRDRRARDAENTAPTAKACIDGLRDAGVLLDDDSRRVVAVEFRIGEPVARGQYVLHIQPVEAVPAC